ncbi:MAG: glycosyltransferase family 4 protein, partial [Caldilineaceae bacterium]|nr:glycosyltransferase family 4 protein [Caldilineaceae bacterium]
EAEALHEAGYQVTVACPQPAGGRWREVTPSGIVLYQFPAPIGGHGALGYLWEYSYTTLMFLLLALLIWCREGFDILHAHNPPDTLFVVPLLFKPFGVRFVYDHHDLAPEIFALRFGARRGAWLHKILLLLERITCRLADQVIATNQSYRAIELERDHVPAGHVTIVRNGPDLNRLHLVPPDPMLRQRARTILCYVGIMGPQDGVDYLLRALHELVYTCNRRDIFCVCIGKGDTIPALRALAQELRIEPYLWFTGWIPDADLLCYLSTADIGLDPDPSNPFNDRSTMIKMMEYMAMGKPIVAFDLPEHHITAADAALYAQPNDVRDFARQIAALIDDSDRRRHMGGIGQQRIAQQFAWPYQAQQLLRAYAALDSQRH